MKFGVLALDYDGTVASDGVLDPDVKAAIVEVRARGIVVILVTGRILADLKRAAGNLDFVDAVVAENGAVLSLPNGQTRLIGHRPPQMFLDELCHRGIPFHAGQCIIEADAASAPQILAVIRELELPLVLLFNRSRLMVLPQALSKSTGLREALNVFRLSAHNAIGIGDAENDHDLLAACEIAVAVSWGSPALQKEADEIVQGDGPLAVAAYIRQVSRQMRLPQGRTGRHQISVGTAQDGKPVAFSIHGRNFLIVGDPGAGKSWATGLACEQMILQGYSVCVIDPEGDYGALESLPGVALLGGADHPPDLPDVARALRHFDLSVVVDLSRIGYEEKLSYLKELLPMLASLRRTTGLPHRIVVDEAHYFLAEANVMQLLDFELGAYAIVTYRPSDLHPDLRRGLHVILANRLTQAKEVQMLLTMAGNKNLEGEWTRILGALEPGEAALLPGVEEAAGTLRRFKLLSRMTPHVRHRSKYFDVEVANGHEFVFTEDGTMIRPPARSLKQFVTLLANKSHACLGGHTRRGDFSNWIAGTFHDHRLASEVRKVEQRYRLGHLDDVRESLSQLIQERYRLSSEQALTAPLASSPS
ncbi:MAG TPA: HAD hydrolase family protein [Terriglobales bacterium]|nr:HAD hydrolase family protein [Terriglobales bacterium]